MGRPSHKDNNQNFSKDPSIAIEEMMDWYGTLVLRTAYFYLSDRHLAEDISQEVFIRAFRSWTKFRGDSSVKTWLMKITINRCRDYLRLIRSTEIPSDTLITDGRITDNLEAEVINKINNTEILKHVLKLPLHYQEVLYLFYYLDFSTVEIAKATGDPEGTIRGRLYRGRKLLGEQLDKEGFEK
jgi:RNA polymerase sigma-70 factor (ECF subfamily)